MNWGIVGTGRIAEKFASTIKEMEREGEKLVAVGSRRMESAKAFGEKYGVTQLFSPYSSLFDSESVDAVYIATPNNLHYEEVKEALEKGKHVLCEKPVTLLPEEARELYELSEQKNLFFMEAYWVWFLPGARKLREIVKSGAIGTINSISLQYGFASSGKRRERKLLSSLGGGALLDIGIYNLAIPQMLGLTSPMVKNTSVLVNEYGTDSWNRTTLEYQNETEVESINAIGEEIERKCTITGSEGTIFIPDFQYLTHFTLQKDGKSEDYDYPTEINGFEYEVREVKECVEKGLSSSLSYTPSDSLAISELIYRIRKLWNMKFQGVDND